MANRVGQQLGNYRLVRLIGDGGFAEVYLGEHVHLGTQAAIKVLLAQLSNQEEQKFREEARTIARLIHPNIVRVLEFGAEGSKIPFLVMDYAPNNTLRDRHPKGTRLPLDVVVSYTRQMAGALQFAHDAKLIHRDIKPENMLVGFRNEILLSDFGIAVVAQSTKSQKTADVIGTVDYMAPEQIKAHPTIASDQYALACVVYEWLAGAAPFQGTATEIIVKHLQVPPSPLSVINPAIPLLVEQVVLRALDKDPAKRFARVEAFATALEHACGLHSALTAPSLPGQPQFNAATTNVFLPGSSLSPTVYVGQPANGMSATSLVGIFRGHTDHVHSVAWSPDRKRFASGGADSIVKICDATIGSELASFKHPGYAVNAVVWSPDGKYVASGGADGTLQKWDVEARKHFATSDSYMYAINSIAWSPDGNYLIAGISGGDSPVRLWDVSSIRNTIFYFVRNGQINGEYTPVTSLAWSPDGRFLAIGFINGRVYIGKVVIGNSDYSGSYLKFKITHTYKGHNEWVNTVAWSSDSRRVASGSEDNTVHIWDASTANTIIAYKKHTNTVRSLVWSPDRKRIASGGDDKTVRVWNATTGDDIFTYSGHADIVRAVAWSPDKRLIASASEDKTVHIWIAP